MKSKSTSKSKIVTSVLAFCSVIGIYVFISESLHDKTSPENTIARKITSNNTTLLASKETLNDKQSDSSQNLPTQGSESPQTVLAQPLKTQTLKTQTLKTQAPKTQAASLARPALSDIRSLDIIDKLNSFDGSENAHLRLAFALNEDYDFQAIQSKQDRKGNQHTRYRQTYRDVPVWGEQVLVHQGTAYKGSGQKGASGGYYSANGKVASGLEFSELDNQLVNIDQSEDTLREIVRIAKETNQHLSAQWATRNAKSELVIYINEQNEAIPAYAVSYLALPRASSAEKDDTTLHIATKTQGPQTSQQQKAMEKALSGFNSLQQRHQQKHHQIEQVQPTRPHMLIDARHNTVIKQWEGLNTAEAHGPGGNEKTGRYEFGTDYPPLLVGQAGDTCTLNNYKVKTVDLQHNFFPQDKAHSFPCPENTAKYVNGAYSPLNDAHFFGGLVFDMFQDWFYLAPLNFQLTMAVHYGRKINNAFWTGEEMLFGDGFNLFYPLVDVNVSAHEVAHGFTEQNSGLFYFDQSGGMNEAFSDIAGEAAEFYWKGEVDWKVGSDISIGDGSLRYFEDPTLDGVSIGHADDFFPFLDVHYSSGVYNRAFYLLATTANWDVRKAFEVFVLANQFYWEPNETFVGGACGVLSAANDLGFEVRDVDNAFQTVGVNCGTVPFTDSDRDGMDNLWEMRFDLNPRDPNDAYTDADGDGLVNVAEYHERTHPQNPDSDGDGINDLLELYVYKTNPNLTDSDYDGLDDYAERETWLTDPAVADTDKDGMPDGWEVKFGLAPRNPDAGNDMDGDGVSNLDEFTHQADPTLVDTDGDGLDDYTEINTHLTKPNLQDSDIDGLMDVDELERGTDPTSRDSDNDYLGDGKEIESGSDPLNADSDNDSLLDGDEVSLWQTNPMEPDTDFDGMPDAYEIQYALVNPRVADSDQDPDGDGLLNRQEYEFETSPDKADTDDDGLNDYVEIFEAKTNPRYPDSDLDGLTDSWEFQLGLDPLDIEDAYLDSDGDGWLNTQEFELGTHPLSATEALDGLRAKPRASDGAVLTLERAVQCIQNERLFYYCWTAFGDPQYGWDGIFQEERILAMRFRSLLPWTVESAYLSFLASTSPLEEDLTAVITLMDEALPENTLFNAAAEAYWEKIKTSPQIDSLTLQANQDATVSSYTTSFDLPPISLNRQSVVIGKSISNLQKRENIDALVFDEALSNRLTVTFSPDADEDGITDNWEVLNGLDPTNPADAFGDRDQDGAINLQEYLLQTNLDHSDSDGDGLPDGWEIRYGLDPHVDDGHLDRDIDGLNNLAEFKYNTSPLKLDSDGDGIDDKTEVETRMTAQYDEQYQAPVCHTVNVQCRSGDLLSGRSNVHFQPEINSPNTLYGACLDGSEEADENTGSNWVESIIISSTDLLELTVGKTAEISVMLNSSVLANDNYVDIYYTSQVEQPEWTLLESFRLTAQTVNGNTNEYAFPIRIPISEQNKHAIRAIYRYGDSPTACSEDARVDHDDLVFSVHTEANPIAQAPVVQWAGLTDTFGSIEVSEDTVLRAIALDNENIDRVIFEIVDRPWGLPNRVFSQSFRAPPYVLNWSDTRFIDSDYRASVTAIYHQGELVVDELLLRQSFKQSPPASPTSWPEISLDSPADGTTVKGEVAMAISVFDSIGVAYIIVEIVGEDNTTYFSRTLPQDTYTEESPNPVPQDCPPFCSPPSANAAFPSPNFSREFVWDSSNVPAGPYRVVITAFNLSANRDRRTYSIHVEESTVPERK